MQRLIYSFALLVLVSGSAILLKLRPTVTMTASSLTQLGFSRCGNEPCFLGIIAGKTDWETTSSILTAQNFRQDTTKFYFSKHLSTQSQIDVIRIHDKPNVVNSISLLDLENTHKITIQDVLELYGRPKCVWSDYDESFWFKYPNITLHALSEDNIRVPATAKVVLFNLVDPDLPQFISGINICEEAKYSTEYLLWFTVLI